MGCIYKDSLTGDCSEYDCGLEVEGCDENGYCTCYEDPGETCSQYENDGNEESEE